ncbi:MAG TPA: Fur family transcriptional regulator [Acidimicrobiales bacterium]|nr:Fur family transcriptional regulator [Acidimicrobiales bacterium]
MSPDLHATAAARLRDDGQRYTTNRRALVEALDEAEHPLTIPELLARRSGIPQSSAYRNLAVLERAGVVDRLVTTDEFARFELAEDLTEHHHHLICSSCGAVADVPADPRIEELIEQAVTRAAAATGFQVEAHRVDLVGRCATCVA